MGNWLGSSRGRRALPSLPWTDFRDGDVVLVRTATNIGGLSAGTDTANVVSLATRGEFVLHEESAVRFNRVGVICLPKWLHPADKKDFSADTVGVLWYEGAQIRWRSAKWIFDRSAEVVIRPLSDERTAGFTNRQIEDFLSFLAAVRDKSLAESREHLSDMLEAMRVPLMQATQPEVDQEERVRVEQAFEESCGGDVCSSIEQLVAVTNRIHRDKSLAWSADSVRDLFEHRLKSATSQQNQQVEPITKAEFVLEWQRSRNQFTRNRTDLSAAISGAFVTAALRKLGLFNAPEMRSKFYVPLQFAAFAEIFDKQSFSMRILKE